MDFKVHESSQQRPEHRGRVFTVQLAEGESHQDLINALVEAISLGTFGDNVDQEQFRGRGEWLVQSEYGEFALAIMEKGRTAHVVVARCEGEPQTLLEMAQLFMSGQIERNTVSMEITEVDDGGIRPLLGYTLHATPLPLTFIPSEPPPIPGQ